jgi:hypothetical protein
MLNAKATLSAKWAACTLSIVDVWILAVWPGSTHALAVIVHVRTDAYTAFCQFYGTDAQQTQNNDNE